jgi:hypothetical protein
MLQTLASILQMTGGNSEAMESPIMQKILDLSNLSAVDVSTGTKEGTPERPQTPQLPAQVAQPV